MKTGYGLRIDLLSFVHPACPLSTVARCTMLLATVFLILTLHSPCAALAHPSAARWFRRISFVPADPRGFHRGDGPRMFSPPAGSHEPVTALRNNGSASIGPSPREYVIAEIRCAMACERRQCPSAPGRSRSATAPSSAHAKSPCASSTALPSGQRQWRFRRLLDPNSRARSSHSDPARTCKPSPEHLHTIGMNGNGKGRSDRRQGGSATFAC